MYQKSTLSNGLRVVTAHMPHVRSVSICVFVGVGSRYESDAEGGVSHFIEHLLFKGTAKRPTSREISEAIEGVGGVLNGGTDKELTIYWCKVAGPHFPLALDVLTDVLVNSCFDLAEMEKERQVILSEMNMCVDSPSTRVAMLIDEVMFPAHPLGREVAGTKESVSTLTKPDMLGFLQRKYLPNNTVIAIAGDIEHQAALDAVGQALGGWLRQELDPRYERFVAWPEPRLKVEKRETEQAQVCLGLPGVSLRHPRRFQLDLLNVILGEGMSSRLFAEIRDKLGLAYSIQSYVDHFLDTGSTTIHAGVEPNNLTVAVKAILGELARLKEPIPGSELTKAKELSKGRLLLRMEDSRSVAGWGGGQEILTGEMLTVDQVIAIIEGITSEQLTETAREFMNERQVSVAVVGPVADEGELRGVLGV